MVKRKLRLVVVILLLPIAVSQGGNPPFGSTLKNHTQADAGDDGNNNCEFAGQLIFRAEPPKHVLQGAVNGFKSAFIGSFLGLASFIAFPVAFSRSFGLFWGSLGGLAVGAIAGSFSVAGGVLFGVYQIVLGMVQTPFCLEAVLSGKRWDPQERTWKWKSLAGEWMEIEKHQCNGRDKVEDMHFYDLLGVSASATSSQIKRAYYVKARDLHPDKNPGDTEASARFHELHTAYQTLYDSESRAAYDEWGMQEEASSSSLPFLNNSTLEYFRPDVFWAVVFASQDIETYVGESTVSSFLSQMLKRSRTRDITIDSISMFRHESKFKQRKRQTEIAMNLLNRITPFVDGGMTETAFRKSCHDEATKIAQSRFGNRFLKSIGTNLVLQADVYSRFRQAPSEWPSGVLLLLRKATNKIQYRLNLARKTFSFMRELVEVSPRTKPVSPYALGEALSRLFEIGLAYNEGDIAYTIEGACGRLFDDSDLESSEARLKRIEAVRILGEEFVYTSLGEADDLSSDDVLARLTVAYEVSKLSRIKDGKTVKQEEPEQMIRMRKAAFQYR